VSQNPNPDQVQPRREETVGLPLLRREVELPAQYVAATPAIPAIPAERVQDRLLEPLLPAEKTEPRFYRSTRPNEALRLREDDEDPETKPRLLEREPTKQPTDDGHGQGGNGNQPPPTDHQSPPTENHPATTSRSTAHGSVFVDTEKLSQGIPGLDQIMRRMFSIGNSTANALAGYQLDRGDSYGEAWTKTADPISTQILEGLANAGTVFGDTAEGAHLMVHNYNVTEENAIDSAGGLFSREK
jgi:hypothetical protein